MTNYLVTPPIAPRTAMSEETAAAIRALSERTGQPVGFEFTLYPDELYRFSLFRLENS